MSSKVAILLSSKHLSNPYVSAPVQGYPGHFILIGAWLFSFVMMRNLSFVSVLGHGVVVVVMVG